MLKTEGRTDESVAAYRKAIAHDPAFGEAYWSLANLKTFRFGEADLAAMRAGVADPAVIEENRVHMHFALGKALEDAGEYDASFGHYEKANALHRARHPYDADKQAARVRHLLAVFTREFFDERAGAGSPDGDPIFIVGMPRSGSTLIEQILSSHPPVEGTMELPEIISMARELRALGRLRTTSGPIPDVLAATAPPRSLRALGERYLERTRVHRKTEPSALHRQDAEQLPAHRR